MRPVTVPFFISHQGCPHTCVFCDQRTISGSAGSLPGAEEMLAAIAAWRDSAGGRPLEVAFFGGSFTALAEGLQARLLGPLQPLLTSGRLAGIRLSTRPDYIDDQRVAWLKESGVRIIELGIQSLDDAVLAASGRGHSAAQSEAAMACIKRHGLLLGAQLMPGLPGDSPRASLTSLERVIAAGADFLRIYPTVVLRGTELARRYAAGQYLPLNLEGGIALCKLLLLRALQAGLPVIRIGLQADEGLTADTLLAGCWHPALGQLVRSGLYGDLISRCVSPGEDVVIRCHPSRLSDVLGQKKCHLKELAERGIRARVSPDAELGKTELVIEKNAECCTYDLLNDLHYSIDEV